MIDFKLNTEDLLVALCLLFHGLILFITFVKWYLNRKNNCRKESKGVHQLVSDRTKYHSLNVFKWRTTTWFGSLGFTLLLVLVVFSLVVSNGGINDESNYLLSDDLEFVAQRTHKVYQAPELLPEPLPKKKKVVKQIVHVKIKLAEAINHPKDFKKVILSAEPQMAKAPKFEFKAPVEIIKPKKKEVPEKVHLIAEEMPLFPGTVTVEESKKAVLDYIYKNIRYPKIARENNIEGKAVVRFVIDSTGMATDIKILKDPGGGIGKEAQKIVRSTNELNSPWIPGKQGGKKVKVAFTLPIDFKLKD